MKENLFLFFGESSFRILQELRRWKREFVLKFGEQADTSVLQGKDLRLRGFLDLISTPPLFSPKRLIVVLELPPLERGEFQEILENIHPQTILVFIALDADRRSAIMRALLKQASVKRFDHLTSLSLKHWMREEARSHGITLTEESVRALTDIVGTDQWYLHWEIAKLALLGKELPSREDISAVCLPGGAQTVWHLRDLLARGDAKGALRYVQQLLSRGESPTKLWNILLWMVRQALSVCLLEEGVEQGEKKHRTEFVHSSSSQPFRRIAERFSRAGPGYIAAHFLEREEATKSGKIRSSDEHPEEILALLEREILELTSG